MATDFIAQKLYFLILMKGTSRETLILKKNNLELSVIDYCFQ